MSAYECVYASVNILHRKIKFAWVLYTLLTLLSALAIHATHCAPPAQPAGAFIKAAVVGSAGGSVWTLTDAKANVLLSSIYSKTVCVFVWVCAPVFPVRACVRALQTAKHFRCCVMANKALSPEVIQHENRSLALQQMAGSKMRKNVSKGAWKNVQSQIRLVWTTTMASSDWATCRNAAKRYGRLCAMVA